MPATDKFLIALTVIFIIMGVGRLLVLEYDMRKGEERYQEFRRDTLERMAGRGEWLLLAPGHYRCSHCGREIMCETDLIIEDRYCSGCGWKMI